MGKSVQPTYLLGATTKRRQQRIRSEQATGALMAAPSQGFNLAPCPADGNGRRTGVRSAVPMESHADLAEWRTGFSVSEGRSRAKRFFLLFASFNDVRSWQRSRLDKMYRMSCLLLFSGSVLSNSLQPPQTAALQASLSSPSPSLLKLMSIELVMPSNHLILSPPSPPALNLSQHQGLFH